MKKTLLLLSFLIACVHIRSSSATDSIDFQTSASFEKAGHLPVSKLEVFQNKQQLIDYLSKISSDTTELTAVPDFGSESSVAIAYAFNQYYKLRKSIVRILPGDTIVIILHVDSIPLNTSILIGQGYSVNLITIPKTDNPIITKLESFMVLINKPATIQNTISVRSYALNGVFDLAGRSSLRVSQRSFSILADGENGRVRKIIKIH